MSHTFLRTGERFGGVSVALPANYSDLSLTATLNRSTSYLISYCRSGNPKQTYQSLGPCSLETKQEVG